LIPIFWNMLSWLKYDLMHIFMHHLSHSLSRVVVPATLHSVSVNAHFTRFERQLSIENASFLVLWDYCTNTGNWMMGQIRLFEGKYGYLRANTDILRANTDIALRANNQHWRLAIIGHYSAKTNLLQQNVW
jgi:hypothetical protein